jgi:hypothetical protein
MNTVQKPRQNFAMPAGVPTMPVGMVPAGMAGGLPPGWQLAVDAMGRPFYYNYFTQQTSWTPPSGTNNVPPIAPSSMYSVPAPPASVPAAPPVSAPAAPPSTAPVDDALPPGWEEATDPQGIHFFIVFLLHVIDLLRACILH